MEVEGMKNNIILGIALISLLLLVVGCGEKEDTPGTESMPGAEPGATPEDTGAVPTSDMPAGEEEKPIARTPSQVEIKSEKTVAGRSYTAETTIEETSWFSGVVCKHADSRDTSSYKGEMESRVDTIDFTLANTGTEEYVLRHVAVSEQQDLKALRISVNGKRLRNVVSLCNADVLGAGESITCSGVATSLRTGTTTFGKEQSNVLQASSKDLTTKMWFKC
jgi:hypothetical protein